MMSERTIKSGLGVDAAKADEIRGLLTGRVDPAGYASVVEWMGRCHNRPRRDELVMEALNEAMGGFGVEAVNGEWENGYWCDVVATYVNMGDSYAPTVIRCRDGVWRLTSVGDFVERFGRRFGI